MQNGIREMYSRFPIMMDLEKIMKEIHRKINERKKVLQLQPIFQSQIQH